MSYKDLPRLKVEMRHKMELSISKMPTSITSDYYPIHKWYNFIAGYAPEYIHYVIDEFDKKNGYFPCKIYDPFAGCATTNVVSNSYGIPSIGVERNPFFYRIGLSKTSIRLVYSKLPVVEEDFLKIIYMTKHTNLISTLSTDAKCYLLKLFDQDVLEKLLVLREHTKTYSKEVYIVSHIFLSKILEYTTHAKTDGIYKAPTSVKRSYSIQNAFDLIKQIMHEGELQFREQKNLCNYKFNSSIDYILDEDSIDLVVFSPPYLNNFDFAEMTRMQMYFWEDARNWSEISENHRNHMLVNTTTALKLVRTQEQQNILKSTLPISLQIKINPLIAQLNDIKKAKPSKKEYNLLFYPYLAQMNQVLKNCFNGLRRNGEIHIIVSDAAFYGFHIDTHIFLYDLLENIGFTGLQIIQMRSRGNRWILDKRVSSGRQLGEYEIVGIKEN